MRGSRSTAVAAAVAALGVTVLPPARGADDFSGADKLRALYSAEFRFTQDGLPVVPVAVAQRLTAVTISAPTGLRLLPEGEGGPEVRADDAWHVKASGTTPARLRYWTVVWRGRPDAGAAAAAEVERWKAAGERARAFEQGTVFGVAGQVLDRRELVVGVGPLPKHEDAERAAERLAAKRPLAARGVFTELADRPHGQLEAVGLKSGARVRNEGVLWFAPAGDGPIRVEGVGPGAKPAGTFFGRVYVTIDRTGAVTVVNAVPEDRLLAGLVPAEIFPSAPDEALKAQAIAARGELLTKIGTRHVGEPFRLCSDTHCQVYSGAGRETLRTTAAVRATRGEVLFTPDGKDLVDTVYSANCGGHTEHNENVWPDAPPHATLRGRPDGAPAETAAVAAGVTEATLARFIAEPPRAFCAATKAAPADRFRWTVTRTPAELAASLAAYRVGAVKGIEVLERGVSGRARAIRITGAERTEVIRGELRIRQAFGGLRSSMFLVKTEAGGATFWGGGYGHGVGLCQTGAIGMAEAGRSYRDILQHYYRGAVLRKIW